VIVLGPGRVSVRALPLPEPPPAESVFVTMAEVDAGASLLAWVAKAVMSLNAAALKKISAVRSVVGVRSVSLALVVPEAAAVGVGRRPAEGREDIGVGRTGDANEALPAAAAAAHAALLSTCAARRSFNDFPIRTIV